MSLSVNFPTVRPSLSLDFASTKRLDPRITFARAATAVYYDGVTTAKAEENLVTYSQQFFVSGTPWVGLNVSGTDDTATAPDGTSTADKLIASAVSGNHRARQNIGAAGTYVFSLFAKAAEYTRIALGDGGTTNVAVFDLSAGTVTPSGTVSNASITAVANGFYRCVITVAVTTSGPHIWMVDNSSSFTFTGNGTDGVLVWGAQLEQRSTVTAYTPTTTQAITNYIPKLQTAAADVARFDCNPTTGESLGLLIEEARTNLLLYSDQIDNAWWSKVRASVTVNAVVAPDGTLSADKLVEDTTNGSHYIYRSAPSFTAGASYTLTVYAKAGERTKFEAYLPSAAFGGVANCVGVFDLTAVTATNTGSAGTVSITPVGNGWYRCSVSAAATITATANTMLATLYQSSSVASYTGDGYSGIYIWGAQLEAGAFATSYIPTVASQVTRAADAASMTGTNFSSWYRADEGTMYAEAKANAAVVGQTFASIDDGSTNNAINLLTSPSNSGFDRYQVNVGGTAQAALGSSGFVPTNTNKMSGAYKVNDFSRAINGGAVLTDTSGTVPVVNALRIGNQASGYFLNGTMKKLAYYPKRLSDTQLQALTLS